MRKEKSITITADGRDQGKRFHIREMSATRAEDWAIRLMLAMGASGIQIPDGLARHGMAGLMVALQSGGKVADEMLGTVLTGLRVAGIYNLLRMPYELAKPLLDEMLGCVQIIEPAITRGLTEGDIEEVTTLLLLRKEVWELHTGFFPVAGPSTSASDPPAQPAPSSTIKPPRPRSPR